MLSALRKGRPMSVDLALAIVTWVLGILAAWLALGALVALAVARFIAIGDYDERSERSGPRHVAPRAVRPAPRVPRRLQCSRRGLTCRPGHPCSLCERITCMATPCCPHCQYDPTNDQL
jgi:hypothetical protein